MPYLYANTFSYTHTPTYTNINYYTERLSDLVSLEYLDLRGNSISSVNDLDELRTVSIV